MPAPALSIIRAYTHAHTREELILCGFLRGFCTNSPEFEPKRPKNRRIFRKNALFCAESA